MKRDHSATGRRYARTAWLVVVATAMALTTGCSIDTRQPSLKIDIYTPVYAPPTAAGLPPLPVILRVDRFTVAPEFNTVRMAYKEGPHRIGYYNYHRWDANPADIVSYFTARDLRATGRFAGVTVPGSGIQPSHRIEGTVDGFHEVDEGNGQWFSELAVTITLLRDREPDVSRRVLFQKTYHHRERVSERSPNGVASGMSLCLGIISNDIAADVAERLSRPRE